MRQAPERGTKNYASAVDVVRMLDIGTPIEGTAHALNLPVRTVQRWTQAPWWPAFVVAVAGDLEDTASDFDPLKAAAYARLLELVGDKDPKIAMQAVRLVVKTDLDSMNPRSTAVESREEARKRAEQEEAEREAARVKAEKEPEVDEETLHRLIDERLKDLSVDELAELSGVDRTREEYVFAQS